MPEIGTGLAVELTHISFVCKVLATKSGHPPCPFEHLPMPAWNPEQGCAANGPFLADRKPDSNASELLSPLDWPKLELQARVVTNAQAGSGAF
jgi:hypothetical protein